ncbi:hypothetical protein CDAR_127641 [Caerostris darwini]|uniref:Uncharacterized protein n=1 Tax=Caerostris darwini TaxID=1538125 RepID=A0AAV4QAQ8_9ARAC|nr:hypothetical protein CDAR_127641 [Caerostris darwini]
MLTPAYGLEPALPLKSPGKSHEWFKVSSSQTGEGGRETSVKITFLPTGENTTVAAVGASRSTLPSLYKSLPINKPTTILAT